MLLEEFKEGAFGLAHKSDLVNIVLLLLFVLVLEVSVDELILYVLELVLVVAALMHAAEETADDRAGLGRRLPWIVVLTNQLLDILFSLKASLAQRGRVVRQLRLRLLAQLIAWSYLSL